MSLQGTLNANRLLDYDPEADYDAFAKQIQTGESSDYDPEADYDAIAKTIGESETTFLPQSVGQAVDEAFSAGAGFAKGFVPGLSLLPLPENWSDIPYPSRYKTFGELSKPQTGTGAVGAGVGELGGFITGLPMAVGKTAVKIGAKAIPSLLGKTAGGVVPHVAKGAVSLGVASGVSRAPEAVAEKGVTPETAGDVLSSTASGAAIGAAYPLLSLIPGGSRLPARAIRAGVSAAVMDMWRAYTQKEGFTTVDDFVNSLLSKDSNKVELANRAYAIAQDLFFGATQPGRESFAKPKPAPAGREAPPPPPDSVETPVGETVSLGGEGAVPKPVEAELRAAVAGYGQPAPQFSLPPESLPQPVNREARRQGVAGGLSGLPGEPAISEPFVNPVDAAIGKIHQMSEDQGAYPTKKTVARAFGVNEVTAKSLLDTAFPNRADEPYQGPARTAPVTEQEQAPRGRQEQPQAVSTISRSDALRRAVLEDDRQQRQVFPQFKLPPEPPVEAPGLTRDAETPQTTAQAPVEPPRATEQAILPVQEQPRSAIVPTETENPYLRPATPIQIVQEHAAQGVLLAKQALGERASEIPIPKEPTNANAEPSAARIPMGEQPQGGAGVREQDAEGGQVAQTRQEEPRPAAPPEQGADVAPQGNAQREVSPTTGRSLDQVRVELNAARALADNPVNEKGRRVPMKEVNKRKAKVAALEQEMGQNVSRETIPQNEQPLPPATSESRTPERPMTGPTPEGGGGQVLKPIGRFKTKAYPTSYRSPSGWVERPSEWVDVFSLSEPINIRGKSSSGNWAVDYDIPSTLGKTGRQTNREYFYKKNEALEWIEQVRDSLPKADAALAKMDMENANKAITTGERPGGMTREQLAKQENAYEEARNRRMASEADETQQKAEVPAPAKIGFYEPFSVHPVGEGGRDGFSVVDAHGDEIVRRDKKVIKQHISGLGLRDKKQITPSIKKFMLSEAQKIAKMSDSELERYNAEIVSPDGGERAGSGVAEAPELLGSSKKWNEALQKGRMIIVVPRDTAWGDIDKAKVLFSGNMSANEMNKASRRITEKGLDPEKYQIYQIVQGNRSDAYAYTYDIDGQSFSRAGNIDRTFGRGKSSAQVKVEAPAQATEPSTAAPPEPVQSKKEVIQVAGPRKSYQRTMNHRTWWLSFIRKVGGLKPTSELRSLMDRFIYQEGGRGPWKLRDNKLALVNPFNMKGGGMEFDAFVDRLVGIVPEDVVSSRRDLGTREKDQANVKDILNQFFYGGKTMVPIEEGAKIAEAERQADIQSEDIEGSIENVGDVHQRVKDKVEYKVPITSQEEMDALSDNAGVGEKDKPRKIMASDLKLGESVEIGEDTWTKKESYTPGMTKLTNKGVAEIPDETTITADRINQERRKPVAPVAPVAPKLGQRDAPSLLKGIWSMAPQGTKEGFRDIETGQTYYIETKGKNRNQVNNEVEKMVLRDRASTAGERQRTETERKAEFERGLVVVKANDPVWERQPNGKIVAVSFPEDVRAKDPRLKNILGKEYNGKTAGEQGDLIGGGTEAKSKVEPEADMLGGESRASSGELPAGVTYKGDAGYGKSYTDERTGSDFTLGRGETVEQGLARIRKGYGIEEPVTTESAKSLEEAARGAAKQAKAAVTFRVLDEDPPLMTVKEGLNYEPGHHAYEAAVEARDGWAALSDTIQVAKKASINLKTGEIALYRGATLGDALHEIAHAAYHSNKITHGEWGAIKRAYGNEEVFARDLAKFGLGEKEFKAGPVKRAMQRVVSYIKDVLDRLGIRDLTAEDVWRRILSGEVGGRRERAGAWAMADEGAMAQAGRQVHVTPEEDAAYMRAVESGDTETAQRMVGEAAKKAGYNVGPVWHGTPDSRRVEASPRFDRMRMVTRTRDAQRAEEIQDELDAEFKKTKGTSERTDRYYELLDKARANRYDVEEHAPVFFTDNWGIAKTYASDERAFDYQGATAKILAFRLKMENPKETDAHGQPWGKRGGYAAQEAQIEEAKAQGHDGLIIRRTRDAYEDNHKAPVHDVFVTFSPSQIKYSDAITRDDSGRVIPLSERFNPESPDIRAAAGEPVTGGGPKEARPDEGAPKEMTPQERADAEADKAWREYQEGRVDKGEQALWNEKAKGKEKVGEVKEWAKGRISKERETGKAKNQDLRERFITDRSNRDAIRSELLDRAKDLDEEARGKVAVALRLGAPNAKMTPLQFERAMKVFDDVAESVDRGHALSQLQTAIGKITNPTQLIAKAGEQIELSNGQVEVLDSDMYRDDPRSDDFKRVMKATVKPEDQRLHMVKTVERNKLAAVFRPIHEAIGKMQETGRVSGMAELADFLKNNKDAKQFNALTPEDMAILPHLDGKRFLADKRTEGAVKSDVTAEELDLIGRAVRHLGWINKKMREMYVDGRSENRADKVAKVIVEIAKEGKARPVVNGKQVEPGVFQAFLNAHIAPFVRFANMPTLKKIAVDDIRLAQDSTKIANAKMRNALVDAFNAAGIRAHTREAERWLSDVKEILLPSGKKIAMTRAELVTLAAQMSDPATREMVSRTAYDSEGKEKERRLQLEHNPSDVTKPSLPARDLLSLDDVLTKGERTLISAFKQHNNDFIAKDLWDIAYRIKGEVADFHPDYAPRQVVRDAKGEDKTKPIMEPDELLSQSFDATGILKSRVETHDLPIRVQSFDRYWGDYFDAANKVIHMAEPFNNMRSLLQDLEVKNALTRQFGTRYANVDVRNFLLDTLEANRHIPTGFIERMVDFMGKNFSASILTLNKSVYLKNLISGSAVLAGEFDKVDFEYGRSKMYARDVMARLRENSGFGNDRFEDRGHIAQYIPLLEGKSQPIADLSFPEAVKAMKEDISSGHLARALSRVRGQVDRIPWMQYFDSIPFRLAWAASEHMVDRVSPELTGKARMDAIRAKFLDATMRTQNGTSSTELSSLASSWRQNPIKSWTLAFTSQVNKMANMLYEITHTKTMSEAQKRSRLKAVGASIGTAYLIGQALALTPEAIGLLIAGRGPTDEEKDKAIRNGVTRAAGELFGPAYFGQDAAYWVQRVAQGMFDTKARYGGGGGIDSPPQQVLGDSFTAFTDAIYGVADKAQGKSSARLGKGLTEAAIAASHALGIPGVDELRWAARVPKTASVDDQAVEFKSLSSEYHTLKRQQGDPLQWRKMGSADRAGTMRRLSELRSVGEADKQIAALRQQASIEKKKPYPNKARLDYLDKRMNGIREQAIQGLS